MPDGLSAQPGPGDRRHALGLRIRAARQAAGLTQVDVSGRLGVSQTALSRWESGDTCPDAEHIAPLAEATGADLRWLLTGEGDAPAAEIPEHEEEGGSP